MSRSRLSIALALALSAALAGAAFEPALAQSGKQKAKAAKAAAPPPPPTYSTVGGFVASFTPDDRTLKLSTGATFELSPRVDITGIEKGKRVSVEWKMHNHTRIADRVTVYDSAD